MLPQIRCAVCDKPVQFQGEEWIGGGLEIVVRCHGQEDRCTIPSWAFNLPGFRLDNAFSGISIVRADIQPTLLT